MKKKETNNHPPRWAKKLLTWYCRPHLLEDLEGDLNEYFQRNLTSRGPRRARLNFILDVLKFMRPYTVRKPRPANLLTQWIMIGNYIKTSGRTMVRNKLFTVINVFGLAVSMSVGLLMIAFLVDLTSYDDYNVNKDKTYRVISRNQFKGDRKMSLATTSVKAGLRMRKDIPAIKDLTIMRKGFNSDAVVGERKFPFEAMFADQPFFRVFPFRLLSGDASTALKEPYSVVLSRENAVRLFGNIDVLGRSIKFDSSEYVVTGVMEDVPKLSHLRFKALVSLSTAELHPETSDGGLMDWGNIYSNYVYFLLPDELTESGVQLTLDKICQEESKSIRDQDLSLTLQPMSEAVLGENLSNPIGPKFPMVAVWVLIGLALVVLLSASFNYTNLSIARSMRRSREVGIRKVMGALKGQVLIQFIIESVMISLVALILSFGMFLVLREQFLLLAPELRDLVVLSPTLTTLGYFLAMAVGTGFFAGLLPALFFTRVNAVEVLKNLMTVRLFSRLTLRRTLIVLQYTFSLMFITATFIGYKQYQGFLQIDLGFSTENIINITLQGNDGNQLRHELEAIPEVTGISQSIMINSLGSLYGTSMKYKDPNDSALVCLNFVDEKYLPLHDQRLLAGHNLTALSANTPEQEAIVNEELLRRFKVAGGDPDKAVGETIKMDDTELTIVGVVPDFHYGTASERILPTALRYMPNSRAGYLNVKVASRNLPETMAKMEAAWKKLDEVHPFNAEFYDDQIKHAYSQFSVMVTVIGFLSFLAVCISSLGLFGMVVFTAETKLREISVRKVLGASVSTLIFLLSKGFLVMLLMAAGIALPLTYFLFDKFFLAQFAYHQPIGMTETFAGAVMVFLVALLMVVSQTLKAARSNPAEVLKGE